MSRLPHVNFEPFSDKEEAEWNGEYREIVGELHLYFPDQESALRFVRGIIEAVETGEYECGVAVAGTITLVEGKYPPSALHNDDGLIERERKEWEKHE